MRVGQGHRISIDIKFELAGVGACGVGFGRGGENEVAEDESGDEEGKPSSCKAEGAKVTAYHRRPGPDARLRTVASRPLAARRRGRQGGTGGDGRGSRWITHLCPAQIPKTASVGAGRRIFLPGAAFLNSTSVE